MCINKLFYQYAVKVRNSSHWYNVEVIDFMNNCVIILYKGLLTPKSFYEIEQVKILGKTEHKKTED